MATVFKENATVLCSFCASEILLPFFLKMLPFFPNFANSYKTMSEILLFSQNAMDRRKKSALRAKFSQ